ncbi:MAG: hypothetical protein JW841_00090 [Deltaproteobacteria bacterium]|nr:hypothetical protein [Deltaproteobacteria bacterium]
MRSNKIFTLLAILLSACAKESDDNKPCKNLSDCKPGKLCVNDVCVSCDNDEQCDAEYGQLAKCNNGYCISPNCKNGSQGCFCEQGQCQESECVNGVCVDCERGSESCSCFNNATCNVGLRCNQQNICENCPVGELNCPCDDKKICNEELICESDICAVDPCPKGTPECPCRENEQCDDELFCLGNGICTVCSSDIVGCPCDVNQTCINDLICAENNLCREAITCEEISCAPHQLCATDTGVDAFCTQECEFGWQYNGTSCDEVEPNCELNAANSLLKKCQDQGRSCVQGEKTVSCGECLDYYIKTTDEKCEPVATCEGIGCAATNRQCTKETKDSNAICGACLPGFVPDGQSCKPVYTCQENEPNSIASVCAAQHRICNQSPNGPNDCGKCIEGYSENIVGECQRVGWCSAVDLDCAGKNRSCEGNAPFAKCGPCLYGTTPDPLNIENCLLPLTCKELNEIGACGLNQFCIEGGPYESATCQDSKCPAGEAWSEYAGGACVGGGGDDCTANCVVFGATGRLWLTTMHESNICICETEPGYYWDNGKRAPQPCDADGDGWIREAARSALESDDQAIRQNARCDLHVIDRFVLENEYQQRLNVFLCEDGLQLNKCESPVLLPLYESVRNDDQAQLDLIGETTSKAPEYKTDSGRRLRANEINSLTRACVDEAADYNDNRVADINEWHGMTSPTFSAAEQIFANFSFLLELHRNFYEPGTQSLQFGQYVIQERSRCDVDFPLQYEKDAGSYWRECTRGRAADYDSTDGQSRPDFGMDFARWSCDARAGTCPIPPPPTQELVAPGVIPAHGLCSVSLPIIDKECIDEPNGLWLCVDGGVWRGMSHHSQFRCVVVSSETYNTTPVLNPDALVDSLWVLNQCHINCPTEDQNCIEDCKSGKCISSSKAISEYEPNDPNIKCSVNIKPSVGSVGIAAANFINGSYKHGCIDEWSPRISDNPKTDPVVASWRQLCTGWQTNQAATFGVGNDRNFGELQCGCGSYHYSGLACEDSCPQNQVMLDPNFQTVPRKGLWLCGQSNNSASSLLGSQNTRFEVSGNVPIIARDRTVMCASPPCTNTESGMSVW